MMMIYKIHDICDLIAGFAFKSKDFGNYSDKVIKIADIQPPIVNMESTVGVDTRQYDINKLQKFIVAKGDYVLAMTGATIGKLGRITSDCKAYINQRVLTFRPNEQIVNKDYLYYSLCSNNFTKYILNHIDSETAQPNISAGSVGGFEISLPSLGEQRRIVDILIAIDRKIEINKRINDNLEQQAEALYKSWFVDFEPFKDGKFIESELGQIPEGWRIYTLNELMDIKRGSSPRPIQSYLSETGLKWLKISDATSCNSPFIYEIQEHIKSEGLRNTVYLQKGALVLSNSATPGLPKILGIDTCIHDGWLYFPISKLSNPFMYLMFIKFRENLISQANGSVFMNLKTEIVKNLKIALPKREIIEQFDLIISSIFNEIRNRTEEMLILSKQRDTLLPKLMSGEIKINEIDC